MIKIKKLIKICFFVIILILINPQVSNSQSCGPDVTSTCTYWDSECANWVYVEDPITGIIDRICTSYACKSVKTSTITFPCRSDYYQNPGVCVTRSQYSVCYFPNGTNNPPSIYNCSSSSTDTWAACGGGGTTPTITTTPTPTPSCNPDGTACSGGGGNCCTKVCTNGKCGGVTPTPTPPPPPPGVDCGTCHRGGAPCSGAGGNCCSGVCKKNGTCAGSGGCGGGGGPPPPPPPPPTSPPPPPTATPTPVPLPWFKLKDASLVGNTSINSPIPVSPLTPYDADDPGNRYLIDNSLNSNPGVVSGQNITIGGATVSSKNWSISGKTYSDQTTISKFIDYVKSKKTSLINNGSIVANKINILSGNQTISEATLSGKRPLMIIIQGNVTLTGATLNALNEQQIIMATGSITFPVTISVANGLYIADSLNFGTTANQGIKIIGNIIAQSSFSNARQWSNGKKPGLFIVFDPSHYIGMLDMLSTITYDWRQIQ